MRRRARTIASTLVGMALVALAGCAAGVAGGTDPHASDLAFQWEVKRFYAGRATEQGGSCTRPAIRTITDVRTIEEDDAEVVKEIRYFWRDDSVRRSIRRPALSGGSMSCQGFENRQFTFERQPDGSLEVVEMSGERRNVRQNFGVGRRV